MGEVRDLGGGSAARKKKEGEQKTSGARARPPKADRQPEAEKSSDDSSSGDERDKKPAKQKPDGATKGAPRTAFPSMKGPGKAGYDKAVEDGKAKFTKHCMSFLFFKCTRPDGTCKFKHTVPKGFKTFVEGKGFKSVGASAKGVTHD